MGELGVAWLTANSDASGWRCAGRLRGASIRGAHSAVPLVAPLDAPTGLDLPGWSRTEFLQRVTAESLAVLVDANWRDASLVEELAQRGASVWLEDGLAWPDDWVESLADHCRANGGQFLAGTPLRTRPDVREVHRALADRTLGDPGVLRLHDWRSDSTPLAGAPLADGSSLANAALSAEARGVLDLVLWLLDAVPNVVWATRPAPQPEDATPPGDRRPLQVHLGFASGAMALLDRARLPGSQPDYFSLSVLGTAGAAYADDHHNRQLVLTTSGPRAISTPFGDTARRELWQQFVEAARDDQAAERGRQERQRLRRVAEAVQQSLETGAAVPLAP
jgi:predicted dehydrogenase